MNICISIISLRLTAFMIFLSYREWVFNVLLQIIITLEPQTMKDPNVVKEKLITRRM